VWYYIDAAELDGDTEVVPRFFVYPIPDKAYEVTLGVNIMPTEMTLDADKPRLPANCDWDILFPLACEDLALTDPRYNGGNKDGLVRQAEAARIRLKSFANNQKSKQLRLVKRGGW
tara:strand:+ start:157 stop:504 length:348 start_codon:yes stop_codon:yes gene_type:complete